MSRDLCQIYRHGSMQTLLNIPLEVLSNLAFLVDLK